MMGSIEQMEYSRDAHMEDTILRSKLQMMQDCINISMWQKELSDSQHSKFIVS